MRIRQVAIAIVVSLLLLLDLRAGGWAAPSASPARPPRGRTERLPTADDFPALVTSHLILGVYDSAEGGTAKENELIRFVAPQLRALGLKLVLHDLHGGLPKDALVARTRGIVTWFRDGTMPNAAAYVRWLARWSRAGKQVAILHFFGAYQDEGTKEWLSYNTINEVLGPIGLSYLGGWNADSEKHAIVCMSSGMGKPNAVDLKRSLDYYRIDATRDDLHKWLVLRRTDTDGPVEGAIPECASGASKDAPSDSVLVATSPSGGFALHGYLFTPDPKRRGRPDFHLDLRAFLRESLLPWPGSHRNDVLVIYDPASPTARGLLNNLYWIRRYTRVPFVLATHAQFRESLPGDLRAFSSLMVVAEDADTLGGRRVIKKLEGYVKEGGGLAIFLGSLRKDLRSFLGVAKVKGRPRTVHGIKFLEAFFPGVDRVNAPADQYTGRHRSMVFTAETQLLARGGAPDLPIAWTLPYGRGRIVAWNAEVTGERAFRGYLFQSMAMVRPLTVVPVLGLSVFFVDDCPQPMWGVKIKPRSPNADTSQPEYQLTDAEFYTTVWWPDMLQIARDFGLRFTFLTIFNYDAKLSPPYDPNFFMKAAGGRTLWLAREIEKAGFETGLHGYNHRSLKLVPGMGDPGWPDMPAMVEALRAARGVWSKVWGEDGMPITYVAPHNIITPIGKLALREVFPEVRILATLYGSEEGFDGSEFGPDPDLPGVMDLPRTGDGFVIRDDSLIEVLGVVMMAGVWTHFVHPDDIYDPERSFSRTWSELKSGMADMLRFLQTRYPWLRNRTAREALPILTRYFSNGFRLHLREGGADLRVAGGGGADDVVMVRTRRGMDIGTTTGLELLQESAEHGLRFYKLTGTRARIELQPAQRAGR